jgi:heme exporter protein B
MSDARLAVKSRPTPGMGAQCAGIIYKDLLLEWRGRARLNAVVFFAVLTLLLFSFAVGPQHALLVRLAPGFLWLAILLASVLSLGESMRQESEHASLEGLRLIPVEPRAIYLGKALANVLFLVGLGIILVPITVALYGTGVALGVPTLIGVIVLGVGAISAPGTLYAAIATYARARDILLPLLLFPILVPGLLAAVKATAAVMLGDPMGELASWVSLLAAFNLIYWILCMLLFGRVIEP